MAEIKGGDKLKAALAEISRKLDRGATLKVGFLNGATYSDGTSVAMVAAIQEYGAPGRGIPPRPFFRNMIAEKSDGWPEEIAKDLKRTNYDTSQTLKRVGALIEGQLRQSIVDTNDPPNSPVTNLLKQRFPTREGMKPSDAWKAFADVKAGDVSAPAGKPLVWSGIMINSISSEVTEG